MKVTRRIITALIVMAMTILPATSHAQGYYYDDDDWHETEMPVRRTNGIMILGKGSEMRYMSCYGGCPDNGEAYAQTANTYKKTFGRNINVYLMPIPLAVEFYCPPTAYEWSREQLPVMMHMFDCLEGVKAVDIYPTLSEHSDERIYSRSDHHWLPLGAYYAAEKFARVAKVPFKKLNNYDAYVVHDFVGTMPKFSKDNAIRRFPEDFVYYVPRGARFTTTYINYTLDGARKNIIGETEPMVHDFFMKYKDGSAAAYSTFMGGDAKIVKVETSTRNHRRLMILKDSFGNALPGYLFYSFEEIHVIDCRYFNRNMIDYVKGNKITDILFANNMGHASNSATWEMYLKYLEQ